MVLFSICPLIAETVAPPDEVLDVITIPIEEVKVLFRVTLALVMVLKIHPLVPTRDLILYPNSSKALLELTSIPSKVM